MRRDSTDPIDALFDGLERLVAGVARRTVGSALADTHVDVNEYDGWIAVVADLPGVAKSDIEVTCDGATVWLRARSEQRTYDQRIALPGRVEEASATATYNNGVLEVRIDRKWDADDVRLE